MPTKDERKTEAEKHVALMKAFFENETKASAESAVIYEDGVGRELKVPEARFDSTATKVTRDDIVSAAFAADGKTAIVDPATFTRPANGYLNGNFSQEDQLCAESNLYNILQGLKGSYYDKNKDYQRGSLYTDRAVFVPSVQFSHNGVAREMDVVVVSAPNRRRALERNRAVEECDADLSRRVETFLRIAAANGADALVMGAFGCGFYGNDARQVAGLVKTWLEAHEGVFKEVVFSVFKGEEQEAFEEAFGAEEQQQVVVEQVEEPDEDEGVFESEDDRDAGRWVFD